MERNREGMNRRETNRLTVTGWNLHGMRPEGSGWQRMPERYCISGRGS